MIAEFDVTTESPDGGVQVLAVTGELDAATAPRLNEALLVAVESNSDTAILLDLSDCSFIDSTGLGVVVSGRTQALERGRRFELCCAGAQARRILEITGLDDAFGIYETRDAALTSLAA